MTNKQKNLDILEGSLDAEVLNILLSDKTTNKNIIWATNNYESLGEEYKFHSPILATAITGNNERIIKPRADKERSIQVLRSREKAEVFTPSWVCNAQNNLVDNAWFGKEAKRFNTEKDCSWETNYYKIRFPESKTWQDYVNANRMEMSCGEAPYLTSRYDMVSGKYITVKRRIGLLDRKLRIVSENTETQKDWNLWAEKALQSIYGFEWQGDNILLARENLLYAVIESFFEKFKKMPDKAFILKCSDIIAWNIWQMDGMKYVIPDSCHDEISEQMAFFDSDDRESEPCPGCKYNRPHDHNGIKATIKDWETNEVICFVDLIKGGNLYG
ncbi:restriction endonuclease subunit M [Lachnospiraceae bacterium MD329]|nr:restriction endonuclease subunit M [Lachnospiraceae bacterium MD329]